MIAYLSLGIKLIRGQYELNAEEIGDEDYYCQCTGFHYDTQKQKWIREKGNQAQFEIVDEMEETGNIVIFSIKPNGF